jgi:hypothetical protein
MHFNQLIYANYRSALCLQYIQTAAVVLDCTRFCSATFFRISHSAKCLKNAPCTLKGPHLAPCEVAVED